MNFILAGRSSVIYTHSVSKRKSTHRCNTLSFAIMTVTLICRGTSGQHYVNSGGNNSGVVNVTEHWQEKWKGTKRKPDWRLFSYINFKHIAEQSAVEWGWFNDVTPSVIESCPRWQPTCHLMAPAPQCGINALKMLLAELIPPPTCDLQVRTRRLTMALGSTTVFFNYDSHCV